MCCSSRHSCRWKKTTWRMDRFRTQWLRRQQRDPGGSPPNCLLFQGRTHTHCFFSEKKIPSRNLQIYLGIVNYNKQPLLSIKIVAFWDEFPHGFAVFFSVGLVWSQSRPTSHGLVRFQLPNSSHESVQRHLAEPHNMEKPGCQKMAGSWDFWVGKQENSTNRPLEHIRRCPA